MSSSQLLGTGLALGTRVAPELSAATPVGALCALALVYAVSRQR